MHGLGDRLARASPDLLRAMIKQFAGALMAAEADAACGASYRERCENRMNSHNGYRRHDWNPRAGSIELAIPKLRFRDLLPGVAARGAARRAGVGLGYVWVFAALTPRPAGAPTTTAAKPPGTATSPPNATCSTDSQAACTTACTPARPTTKPSHSPPPQTPRLPAPLDKIRGGMSSSPQRANKSGGDRRQIFRFLVDQTT